MKKKNRLSKNEDFKKIIAAKKQKISTTLILYYEKKEISSVNIGISVSKKMGNAIFRNKMKRILRKIIDLNLNLNLKYNLVLIVRKEFINLSFEEKNKEVIYILNKLK